MMRPLLTLLGSVCVFLGVAGIILPLIPTTPFLLLSAWCFARSSDKFYNWLLNHKWLGGYIRRFRSKQGVPVRVKIKAIVLMWFTMGVSAYFLRDNQIALVILAICAVGVSVLLICLPTEKQESD